MANIMGVDGGGSKTYAVIVDDAGKKLGSGISGSSNYQSVGIEVAIQHITEATKKALHEAKLMNDQIDFVEFGLAGADREKDFRILRPAISALGYPRFEIVCDTVIGLRMGSKDQVGVVLVCGSGTNAFGRKRDGTTVQTGGFGYLFGDAAGGFEMARQTFRAAVRSWEQREIPSILPQKVASHLGFPDIEELVNHYLDHNIHTLKDGSLTIVLHEAADEGDELAIRILQSIGYELGIAAYSVITRLKWHEAETIPIVLIGSVIQKGKNIYLLDTLNKTLTEKGYLVDLVIPVMEPVYGAILFGMDHLGIHTTDYMNELFVEYGGYDE